MRPSFTKYKQNLLADLMLQGNETNTTKISSQSDYLSASHLHLQWLEDLIYHHTNGLAAETRLLECQIRRSRKSKLLSQVSGILVAQVLKSLYALF